MGTGSSRACGSDPRWDSDPRAQPELRGGQCRPEPPCAAPARPRRGARAPCGAAGGPRGRSRPAEGLQGLQAEPSAASKT